MVSRELFAHSYCYNLPRYKEDAKGSVVGEDEWNLPFGIVVGVKVYFVPYLHVFSMNPRTGET